MEILLIYIKLFGLYSYPQTVLRYILVSFNIDGAIIKINRSKNPAKFPNIHLQNIYWLCLKQFCLYIIYFFTSFLALQNTTVYVPG